MKWFDRWFYRKAKWAWENRDEMEQDICVPHAITKARKANQLIAVEESGWGDGLRINIKKIIGGYVVSFHAYDRVRDRSDDRHYMITDQQDFERELGKIITLESMKQS
jgi:hypothetical protein